MEDFEDVCVLEREKSGWRGGLYLLKKRTDSRYKVTECKHDDSYNDGVHDKASMTMTAVTEPTPCGSLFALTRPG